MDSPGPHTSGFCHSATLSPTAAAEATSSAFISGPCVAALHAALRDASARPTASCRLSVSQVILFHVLIKTYAAMQRSYRYCARECPRAELGDCTLSCSIRNYRQRSYRYCARECPRAELADCTLSCSIRNIGINFIMSFSSCLSFMGYERECVYCVCVCVCVMSAALNTHFCVLIASVSSSSA